MLAGPQAIGGSRGSSKRPVRRGRVPVRLRDEQAYLQTDEDEKPAVIARPPPDPAQFKCWFCRKSHQQVQVLFGAEYPVRDPNDFATETLIFVCNECVAKFAERLAKGVPGAPP